MQTVYDAAGAADGLLRLANAWHTRVMADEVVSHAFSHGFHPEHSQRLAAYWAEALGGPGPAPVGGRERLGRLLGRVARWPDDLYRPLWRRDLRGSDA